MLTTPGCSPPLLTIAAHHCSPHPLLAANAQSLISFAVVARFAAGILGASGPAMQAQVASASVGLEVQVHGSLQAAATSPVPSGEGVAIYQHLRSWHAAQQPAALEELVAMVEAALACCPQPTRVGLVGVAFRKAIDTCPPEVALFAPRRLGEPARPPLAVEAVPQVQVPAPLMDVARPGAVLPGAAVPGLGAVPTPGGPLPTYRPPPQPVLARGGGGCLCSLIRRQGCRPRCRQDSRRRSLCSHRPSTRPIYQACGTSPGMR